MKKIVLAIQTPRAGEQNHLWITPFVKGESISDFDLGELLSKLKSQLPKPVNTDAPSSLDSPQLTEALSSGVLHNSFYNDEDSFDNEDYDSPSDFPVGQPLEDENAVVNADSSDNMEAILPDNVNSNVKDKRVDGVVVKDGMLFSKTVIQTSSGRPGDEELFLYAFGFDESVPEDKRKECSEKLDVFFNDKLEGIIKTIDWQKAARDTSVHTSADLKNLADGLSSPLTAFDSLYSELADLLEPFIKPEPEPKPIENETEQSDKTKGQDSQTTDSRKSIDAPKPKKSSFITFVLGLCVIIALLVPIVKLAQSGTFGDYVKQKVDEACNWVSKQFNKQQSSDTFNDYTTIWSQLFEFPDDVKPEERKKLVEEAIEQTYRYYYPETQPTGAQCNLDKTVDGTYNGAFTRTLANMTGNLKVLSDNPNKPEFECFRNSDNVDLSKYGDTKEAKFNKLIDDFPEAVRNLKTILNGYLIDNPSTEFRQDIETYIKYLDNNYLNETTIPNNDYLARRKFTYKPKFFMERDLNIKNQFSELINEVKSKSYVQRAIGFAEQAPSKPEWNKFVDDYNSCFNK